MERRIKFFNNQQIQALRKMVRDKALTKRESPVREWAIIDVLTSSGIRVSECADLRCGSLKTGYGQCSLFIANGKGNKSRYVQIDEDLKKHLKEFIAWKIDHDEPVGGDDYLFVGQRGPMSAQAIQVIVKKHLRALGIYEPGKSVHALRHSFAVKYYKQSGHDLMGLKEQLGHSNLSTTQVYAAVLPEDIQEKMKGFWQKSPGSGKGVS
jgi:integrase/recombinase XerD